MSEFGYHVNATNTTDWRSWGDQTILSKEVLSEAGSVSKLSVYVSNIYTGHQAVNAKAVIYSDNAGVPYQLKGTGTATAITDSLALGWLDFVFGSPVALGAGTYWIGLIMDTHGAGVDFPIDTATSSYDVGYWSDTYADGADATFSAWGEHYASNRQAIYATYTASGGASFTGLIVTRLLNG